MDALETFLARSGQPITVAVVRDAPVDEYHQVVVNRLSPEYPTPVMLSATDRPTLTLPGRAATVAYQFTPWPAVAARLVSVVSPYAWQVYHRHGLTTDDCHDWPSTPVKRRYYAGDHPLCRLDIEDPTPYAGAGLPIPPADVQIWSDYSKGLFAHGWFRPSLTVPTIVDPKGKIREEMSFDPRAKVFHRHGDRYGLLADDGKTIYWCPDHTSWHRDQK